MKLQGDRMTRLSAADPARGLLSPRPRGHWCGNAYSTESPGAMRGANAAYRIFAGVHSRSLCRCCLHWPAAERSPPE